MDPVQNQQTPVAATEGKKSFGPIAGVIIIVILLIAGAIFMFGGESDDAANNSSDEVSSIENDLQTDAELNADISELNNI